MASGKLSDKDLAEIHCLAKQWGKIVVRRMFGDEGPGLDIDLDCMEQVAAAAAAVRLLCCQPSFLQARL